MDERERTVARIRNLLNTDDGKLLLQEMEAAYDGPLMGDTTDKTAYNVGRRDVYIELKRLAEMDK